MKKSADPMCASIFALWTLLAGDVDALTSSVALLADWLFATSQGLGIGLVLPACCAALALAKPRAAPPPPDLGEHETRLE
jgi:hypothetical protein